MRSKAPSLSSTPLSLVDVLDQLDGARDALPVVFHRVVTPSSVLTTKIEMMHMQIRGRGPCGGHRAVHVINFLITSLLVTLWWRRVSSIGQFWDRAGRGRMVGTTFAVHLRVCIAAPGHASVESPENTPLLILVLLKVRRVLP